MKDFFYSIFRSFREALAQNEYIIRLLKRYPKFFAFCGARLSFTGRYGFYFSLGAVFSFLFILYFFNLAIDIFSRGVFLEADGRIMNLMASLRDISAAKFLAFFSYFGNWEILLSFLFVAIIFLQFYKKQREALFFCAIYFVGLGSQSFLKLIFHRLRPDVGYSLISASGYSFPSGHALMSLLFYGFLGHLLYRSVFKNRWSKFLLIAVFFFIILLTGFSRIYLGVHWASDILAGWVLGIALLLIFITFLKEKNKFSSYNKLEPILTRKKIFLALLLFFVFAFSFCTCFLKARSLKFSLADTREERIIVQAYDVLIDIVKTDNFPKYSETLIGQKMEPISFIVVADEEDLVNVFAESGWYTSDKVSPKTILKLFINAVLNTSYPTGPVTPSFLNSRPENIAFEKPTSAETLRQRHHARFWQTNYYLESKPVWVATASFDDGLRYFVTHKIRPDIDTERDYIKNDLGPTGLITEPVMIQLVAPMLGHNQGYDQFFTDGKAYVFIVN